jgi:hypothetical protein
MADAAANTAVSIEQKLETPPVAKAENDPALKELGSQIRDLQSQKITPPEPVAMPKTPDLPQMAANPQEWQGLGMALVAMAMISGSHKNNWLGAGQFLNGAMEGYAKGNEELAQRSYAQFQEQMKEAQAESKQRNDQYRELLQDRSKTINEMISQYRVMAAQDGREDMLAASQTRSLVAMTNALMSHEAAEQRIGMQWAKLQANQQEGGDPETKQIGDSLAWQYYFTGKAPPFGMGNSPIRSAFLKGLEDVRSQMGLTQEQFAATMGTQHAATHALNALGSKIAVLEPAEKTALKNFDYAVDLAKKIDPSQFPIINKALLAGDIQSGDPTAAAYKLAMYTALREYTRVSSGNTGAAGLTDSQIKEADSLFNFSSSLPQLIATRNAAATDMNNVMNSYQDQFNSVKQVADQGTAPPAAGASPAADTAKTVDFSQLPAGQ